MDNMFGCIVDIKGNIGNIILLLNNPCKKKDMEDGIMNTNSSSTLTTTFKKGLLKFSLPEEDSIFCISLAKKMYIYNRSIDVITDPNGSYASEVILVFQGMDKFNEVIQFIKDVHMLDVVDLTGTVHAYQNFDRMMDAYQKNKLQDQSLI